MFDLLPGPPLPLPPEQTVPFHLSGGVLWVNGTAGDDVIRVRPASGRWEFHLNAEFRTYTVAQVTTLKAYGYGGNDRIELEATAPFRTTLNGGGGNDVVTGGAGIDLIYGEGGDDAVGGNANDDKIYGGYGLDTMFGHAGADEFLGGPDYDLVSYDDGVYRPGGARIRFGGTPDEFDPERDMLNADIEAVRGTAGPDHFTGDARVNVFYGGPGNDTALGNGGSDALHGEDGHDQLFGGDGADQLFGHNGNDALSGGAGNDTAFGHNGHDKLRGEAGADQLFGGNHNDNLWAGAGPDADVLNGDAGADILVTIGGASDVANGGADLDRFWLDTAPTDASDADSAEIDYRMVHRVGAFRNPAAIVNGDGVASLELAGQDIPNPLRSDSSEGWRNFKHVPLFAAGGPSLDDVNQGRLGDCWFLAAVSATAKAATNMIAIINYLENRIADMGDGTYAVRLGGNYFRVDADLPVRGESPAYAGLGTLNPCLWVALMEKAMVHHMDGEFWRGDYADLDGGFSENAFRALEMTSVNVQSDRIDDGTDLFDYLQTLLGQNRAVTYSTQDEFWGVANSLVARHAYTVDSVFINASGQRMIRLRNPWGTDHEEPDFVQGANDGYIEIHADTAYDSFSRITSAAIPV